MIGHAPGWFFQNPCVRGQTGGRVDVVVGGRLVLLVEELVLVDVVVVDGRVVLVVGHVVEVLLVEVVVVGRQVVVVVVGGRVVEVVLLVDVVVVGRRVVLVVGQLVVVLLVELVVVVRRVVLVDGHEVEVVVHAARPLGRKSTVAATASAVPLAMAHSPSTPHNTLPARWRPSAIVGTMASSTANTRAVRCRVFSIPKGTRRARR